LYDEKIELYERILKGKNEVLEKLLAKRSKAFAVILAIILGSYQKGGFLLLGAR
jgi:hypothetical protein